MNIDSSAIQRFVSKAVAHTQFDTAEKDAYARATAGASTLPVADVAGSTQNSTQNTSDNGHNESFAKMMVNLKAASAKASESASDDDGAAVAAAFASRVDKQIASSDSVKKTVDDEMAAVGNDSGTSGLSSATASFLTSMKSDAESVRQQLTGVSKDAYDKMTPEQQAAVDKKVAELQKPQSDLQVAEQQVKTRIAMAKAEMV